jgi:hypothetical protein
MIPISFAIVTEGMIKQLPQDYTFFLTFGLAVIALVLSYHNFYVTHTRTSQSEQIKTSRDVWVRINEKYDPIIEIMRSEDKSRFTDDRWKMLRPLAWDIDYFAFLIITGEIKDKTLVSYYRLVLSGYIEAIMRDYATGFQYDLLDQFPNFNELVKIWNIKVPKDMA